MTTFTDEDLKFMEDEVRLHDDPTSFKGGVKRLIARLEAAEDLILNHTVTPISYDNKYEDWRKAAGK